jgi:uncharacterized protein (UPF0335 family)
VEGFDKKVMRKMLAIKAKVDTKERRSEGVRRVQD